MLHAPSQNSFLIYPHHGSLPAPQAMPSHPPGSHLRSSTTETGPPPLSPEATKTPPVTPPLNPLPAPPVVVPIPAAMHTIWGASQHIYFKPLNFLSPIKRLPKNPIYLPKEVKLKSAGWGTNPQIDFVISQDQKVKMTVPNFAFLGGILAQSFPSFFVVVKVS